MADGVEEVVTAVARYHEIERLYRSQPETMLKQEFEKHLISLYRGASAGAKRTFCRSVD